MCIKGGYILQPRSIDESEVSSFPPHVREIWLYLIRRANHKDAIVSGIRLKRGQLKTSYRDIIEDLSWNVGYRKMTYKKHHCETAMKMLTREHMIAVTKTTRGMIVTISKYDYYQTSCNYETDSEIYNKDTTKPQSDDTINNNDNNEKKNNKLSAAKATASLHSRCKDAFHDKFRGLFGDEYYWGAKDAANLNLVINKITHNRNAKSMSVDDDSIVSAFNSFLESITDKWILANFSMPNINSKFNEIISQAKNGRKQQTSDNENLAKSVAAGIARAKYERGKHI